MIQLKTAKTRQGFATQLLRTRTPNMESAPYPLIVYLVLIPTIHLRKIKQVKSTLIERIRDTGCLKERASALKATLIEKKTRREDFKKENLTELKVLKP